MTRQLRARKMKLVRKYARDEVNEICGELLQLNGKGRTASVLQHRTQSRGIAGIPGADPGFGPGGASNWQVDKPTRFANKVNIFCHFCQFCNFRIKGVFFILSVSWIRHHIPSWSAVKGPSNNTEKSPRLAAVEPFELPFTWSIVIYAPYRTNSTALRGVPLLPAANFLSQKRSTSTRSRTRSFLPSGANFFSLSVFPQSAPFITQESFLSVVGQDSLSKTVRWISKRLADNCLSEKTFV